MPEQSDIHKGNVLDMGKGFYYSEYLIDRDLGYIITNACHRAVLALLSLLTITQR